MACTKVFQSFKFAVYGFSIGIVGLPEDAEDITALSFATVWENRFSITSMRHLKNYLFFTAKNNALNLMRGKDRHITLSEDFDQADMRNDYLFIDLVEGIVGVVKTMPVLRSKVFRMRYLEGYSPEEVSKVLGIGLQNVYWHSAEGLIQARRSLNIKKTKFLIGKV